jgi:DnaJ-domain-containing protein 1
MENQQEHSHHQRAQSAGEGDIVLKEVMSLENVRETLSEDQGYDAPFATFTWHHWLEAQAHAMQCFTRFVRAVEEHHPDHAIMIGLEMQEIATTMLLEAYAQSTSVPLQELPANHLKRVNF